MTDIIGVQRVVVMDGRSAQTRQSPSTREEEWEGMNGRISSLNSAEEGREEVGEMGPRLHIHIYINPEAVGARAAKRSYRHPHVDTLAKVLQLNQGFRGARTLGTGRSCESHLPGVSEYLQPEDLSLPKRKARFPEADHMSVHDSLNRSEAVHGSLGPPLSRLSFTCAPI